MKVNKLLLKESIYLILEEVTKFQQGDEVITPEGGGVVLLSKHPYYSVKLDSNGSTKPLHVSKIKKKDGEFGKYDINESETEDIIILTGILTSNTTQVNVGSLLSDIRSILGVTIVRNDDVFNVGEKANENYKTQLTIKIDPTPFKGKSEDIIKNYVISEIHKLYSVKKFIKQSQSLTVPTVTQNKIRIPAKDIDSLREMVKGILKEIKINSPATRGKLGAINYLKSVNKLIGDLYPEILQAYNDGRLSQQLADKISSSFNLINKRFSLSGNEDWFVEWVNQYVEDIGPNIKSSNSFFTNLADIDGHASEFVAKELEIDQDDLFELAQTYLTNYDIHWR